jgi:hypothetical protein
MIEYDKSQSQTLITGVYRCGSSYITQLINLHPEIKASMYQVNVLRFVVDQFKPISEEAVFCQALEETCIRISERYNIELDVEGIKKILKTYKTVDYGIFYDTIMSSLYIKDNIKHWAEKNQLLWRDISRFLKMMPNGKAILVIRDPRSVLASFKKYTYVPPPAYLGAIFNCYDAMKYGLQLKDSADSDNVLIVKYENVARCPKEQLVKIWSFLGLNHYEITDNLEQNWLDAYGQPWYSNSVFAKNISTRNGFDIDASIKRWEKNILDSEIFLTEQVCGDLMSEYEYELSGIESNWPDTLRLFMSNDKMTDWFKNWLFHNEGVQQFPTDPTKKENWEENKPLEVTK